MDFEKRVVILQYKGPVIIYGRSVGEGESRVRIFFAADSASLDNLNLGIIIYPRSGISFNQYIRPIIVKY